MRISSTRNPLVQYVRSLERGQVRRREGVYLAEGVRLISEAIQTGQAAPLVLYDPEQLSQSDSGSLLLADLPRWADRAVEVDRRALEAAAMTETPAGVVAVLRLPEPGDLSGHRGHAFGVVLDGLADPGNAGTLLRTADAAGVDFVAAVAGSVELFAPKVVRAGMGAHFRVPLYQGVQWDELRDRLSGSTVVAASAREGASVYRYEWPASALLVIGSEARGLSREGDAAVEQWVHVPMRHGVESLNAAVAGSILIYAALGHFLDRGD